MLNYTHVPKWLVHSFKSTAYRWDQKGKSLELFLHYPVPKFPTRIVLLQHCSELSKSTATGWLVDDNLYHHSIGGTWPSVVPLGPRVHVHHWVWSGRNDTGMIERQIRDLASNFRLFLLWTGGSSNEEETKLNIESQTGSVYIILDGTWQQAQTMFRKIPILWNLPRISFCDIPSSKYILRKDYTGWRERFSARSDAGGDLLCTAEVMAAVLDKRDDVIGANEIRCRLDVFQRNYPHIQAGIKKGKDGQDWNEPHENDL
jgi:DTW domain-containing protein YfiP